mmetsp:Transcript_138331/g.350640  ORF Transcript_138331/g.350640 Transcript_138331/m.350640 type:complete len:111 (+) Transcript_138331:624-956(+)
MATRVVHGSACPPRGSCCSNMDKHRLSEGKVMLVVLVLLTHRLTSLLARLHSAPSVKRGTSKRGLYRSTPRCSPTRRFLLAVHVLFDSSDASAWRSRLDLVLSSAGESAY